METLLKKAFQPSHSPATGATHCHRWPGRVAAVWIATISTCHAAVATIDGISFAARPEVAYVPLIDVCHQLGLSVARGPKAGEIVIQGRSLKNDPLPTLIDGAELVAVPDLAAAGLRVSCGTNGSTFTIGSGDRALAVEIRPKRVEINLATQQLQAWQGNRLVLQSRISSGRGGRTPTGNFKAGPYKARMHHSSLYDNAPMPWSVQIHGNIFIHGFASVPKYPASQGCIRLPLSEGNPARLFYHWVETGTPVEVIRK